ncbi:MAG: tetratricopeptide repeat protein [Desulfobacterales bacterium]|nr:tetratricopeptide repeat protein [Desulfobacterales bacterium]
MQKKLIVVVLIILLSACTSTTKKLHNEDRANASKNLGEAYLAQGDYSSALRELLKAEQISPKPDSFIQNDLGLAYMGKGSLDLSIQHFKKAVEIKPDYAPAKNNLGTAYIANQEWDKAIVVLKELSIDLLYATPHYPLSNIGLAYYNKKDYVSAEEYYKKALQLHPDFLIAINGLGRTYIALYKFKEAIDTLKKGIEISPRYPMFHFEIGRAYKYIHQYNDAELELKQAISLDEGGYIKEDAKKELEELKKLMK